MDKVLNYVWLGLRFPHEAEPFVPPIPAKYLENVDRTAERNPDTEVVVWLDSRRLSAAQKDYLNKWEGVTPSNVRIGDLVSVKTYAEDSFYKRPETNRNWKKTRNATIWKQVDCAKILACLQTGAKQTFFSDMDIVGLDLAAPKIQDRMSEFGVVIGSENCIIENQFLGVDSMHLPAMNVVHGHTRFTCGTGSAQNGWLPLVMGLQSCLPVSKHLKSCAIPCDYMDNDGALHHDEPDWDAHHSGLSEVFGTCVDAVRDKGLMYAVKGFAKNIGLGRQL